VKALIALACLSLTGCASLYWAGVSDYTVALPDGVEITVHSGKEQQSVNATFEQRPGGYIITLQETGVQAFQGQSVAAGAASDAVAAAAAAAVTALKTIK